MPKLSLFNKLVFIIHLVVLAALLCTYPASWVSPKWVWFLAFPALLYPYLLLINVIFLVYWFFNKQYRLLLLGLLVIVLGFNKLEHTIAFTPPNYNKGIADDNTIKIMSYNVRNFDLYSWSDNMLAREKMMQLITQENPDVIAFQEFYTESKGRFQNVQILVNKGYKYYSIDTTVSLRKNDHWGLAIFSKQPIKQSQNVVFEKNSSNAMQFIDIHLNNEIYRIINVHLQSIHLANSDLEYVENFASNKNIDETGSKNKVGTKKPTNNKWISFFSIIDKLKIAYQKRSEQANILAEEIKQSPYPVLLCGDFNDTPTSYSYSQATKYLSDAFIAKGWGLGGTYNGPLPALRIDYILYDEKTWEVQNFNIIYQLYSDHYPISSQLRRKK